MAEPDKSEIPLVLPTSTTPEIVPAGKPPVPEAEGSPPPDPKSKSGKKWYKSKTVWANIILIGQLGLRAYFGFVLTVEEEGALLVTINLVLRAITGEKIHL